MALLEKHRDDLPTFVEDAEPAADGSPEALLRAILDTWLDYVRENHHSWEMLFRDRTGDDEIQALRIEVSVRAREVMADFISVLAGSRIPRDQIAPTAELLTSGLAGMVLWWRDNTDVQKETLAEVAVRFFEPLLAQ
jgi:AcrR family transcriptional regulator